MPIYSMNVGYKCVGLNDVAHINYLPIRRCSERWVINPSDDVAGNMCLALRRYGSSSAATQFRASPLCFPKRNSTIQSRLKINLWSLSTCGERGGGDC